MYLNGYGMEAIARKFNSENIPSWKNRTGCNDNSKCCHHSTCKADELCKRDNGCNNKYACKLKTGWRKSYISKILTSRAVLGEFQPHMRKDKKRVPVGDIQKDYFPRVCSVETFNQVQSKLQSNETFGGRTGKISNLFGGVAKCDYCGFPMAFVNKGNTSKGGKYLVCDNARRKNGCRASTFRYEEFEESFLTFCKSLDYNHLLSNDEKNNEESITLIRRKLTDNEIRSSIADDEINNLRMALKGTDDSTLQGMIMKDIEGLIREQDKLKTEKEELSCSINRLVNCYNNAKSRVKNLHEIISLFKNTEGDELIETRRKLRSQIRTVVDRITVAPFGSITSTASIDFIEENRHNMTEEEFKLLYDSLNVHTLDNKNDRKNRGYIIYLKNDDFSVVCTTHDSDDKLVVLGSKYGDEIYSRIAEIDKNESLEIMAP